jgi:NADH-quinone oxidoreductase subunit L
LIALTQNDLKRVLAYSTLSQLGYMFMALGGAVTGATSLTTFAVVAALFHLLTHAFFKALLFLSAGSVMHAMGNVIDMRRFSGLRTVLPWTHATFLCGALALSAFPFTSGFWSKDDILAALLGASQVSPTWGAWYALLLAVGLVTAALTSFYTFRAYFMTFWGPLKVPPEAGSHGHVEHAVHDPTTDGPADRHAGHAVHVGHAAHAGDGHGVAHESPRVMVVPLVILSFFAIFAGFALGPTEALEHFLAGTAGFPEGKAAGNLGLMIGSSLIGLAGIAVAYLTYVRQPELPTVLARRFQAFYQLSLNKFHFDELYLAFFVRPLEGLAQVCRAFDQWIVDGLVDLGGYVPRLVGTLFRPVQNGLVQWYALTMAVGLVVFLIAFVRSM